jgi:acetyl esterase/lipase
MLGSNRGPKVYKLCHAICGMYVWFICKSGDDNAITLNVRAANHICYKLKLSLRMEASFSYVYEEIEQLLRDNTSPDYLVTSRNNSTSTGKNKLLRIITNFPDLGKSEEECYMETTNNSNDLFVFGSFVGFACHSLIKSTLRLVRHGPKRVSWAWGHDLFIDSIRKYLSFPHAKLEHVRAGLKMGSRFFPVPTDISVFNVKLTINTISLLEYQKLGKSFWKKSRFGRYPIPKHLGSNKYTLEGQWVLPWPQADRSYSASLWQRNFGAINRNESHIRLNNMKSAPRKVILYLHGGCYIFGTSALYLALTGALAKSTGLPVFSVDYRLAPEHPFPSALHDAFAAYLWLIDPTNKAFADKNNHSLHEAFLPENVIISGDSAGKSLLRIGGGLCASLLNYLNLYLRNDIGNLIIPFPRAAVLLSPWVDLSCSSKVFHINPESYIENKEFDVIPFQTKDLHSKVTDNIAHPIYSYCFGENNDRVLDVTSPEPTFDLRFTKTDSTNSHSNSNSDPNPALTRVRSTKDVIERFIRNPLVSPSFGDLSNLPPILIQVGDCELLRDETIAYAYKYKKQNQNSYHSWARHELYKDMVHVFQAVPSFSAAKVALKNIGFFIEEVLSDRENVSKKEWKLTDDELKLLKSIDSHHIVT